MTILEPYSVQAAEIFGLQAELQPATAAHSSGGVFGEAETELGGSVAGEPACSPSPIGSISFSRACALVFCSPVCPSKSGIQSSTINFCDLPWLLLLTLARSLNSSSALLASPSSALFNSFLRANSGRDARFVRPPSRYAARIFRNLLMMSMTSWSLRLLGGTTLLITRNALFELKFLGRMTATRLFTHCLGSRLWIER
jgi:hypothetical protein